jgi:hypothetical protein
MAMKWRLPISPMSKGIGSRTCCGDRLGRADRSSALSVILSLSGEKGWGDSWLGKILFSRLPRPAGAVNVMET